MPHRTHSLRAALLAGSMLAAHRRFAAEVTPDRLANPGQRAAELADEPPQL